MAVEPTSKQELVELREMVALNLKDAQVKAISAQGRYEFAYNAARLLATIVIRACGYRVTSRSGHHYYTFQALAAAGTVVELLAPGVFEVEFSDDEGRTYAQLPLDANQLMVLHSQPQRAA